MNTKCCHIVVGAPSDIIGFKTMRLLRLEDIGLCILDDAEKIYSTESFRKQIMKPLNDKSCRFIMLAAHTLNPPMLRKWDYIENLDEANYKQFFVAVEHIVDKLEAVTFIYKMLKETNTKGIVFCQVSIH